MKYIKILNDKSFYNGDFVIKNELFTEKEFVKKGLNKSLNKNEYTEINVNKNKTGFVFGARLYLGGELI